MVTRRSMILGGGAAAIVASAGFTPVDAKKKKKKKKTVTKTFSNATAVTTTNAGGAATPYPSSIKVSGFKKGKILKVRVFLNGYSYDAPDGIDMMLSATQISGQTAVIMSDVGDAVAVNNVNLILDDNAANALPDDAFTPPVSGTYKPANYVGGGGADMFPPPAPTSSGASALSAFNGANPNGTWQLWVVDAPGNGPAQFAGGWKIEITAQVKKKK